MKITRLDHWILPQSFNSIPFGIHVTGDSNKIVVITWTDNILTTFVFKDPSVAFENSSSPYKISAIDIPENEIIVDVITTPAGTIFYTDSGNVQMFTSNKCVRELSILKGSKYISNGLSCGLIVIRHDLSNKVFIEIYPYTSLNDDESMINNVRQFDLTWDSNYLSSTRYEETYSIICLKFNKTSKNLLEYIIGAPIEETLTLDVILISIESTLFWFKYSDDDLENYSLIPMVTTSSKIKNIFYSNSGKFILLILESGLIEIIYFSQKFCLVRREYHNLDSNINWIEFINDQTLFYANNEQIIQISFKNKDDTEIEITNKEYKIEGIVCFSCNVNSKKLLCLSSNRIYSVIDLDLQNDTPTLEYTGGFQLKIDEEVERSYGNFTKKLQIETEDLQMIKNEILHHKRLTQLFGCLSWQEYLKENIIVDIYLSQVNIDTNDRAILVYNFKFQSGECLHELISGMRIQVQVQNCIDCSIQNYIWIIGDSSGNQPYQKSIKYIMGNRPVLPRFKTSILSTIDSFDDSLCFEVSIIQNVNIINDFQKLVSISNHEVEQDIETLQSRVKFLMNGEKGKEDQFEYQFKIMKEMEISTILEHLDLSLPNAMENNSAMFRFLNRFTIRISIDNRKHSLDLISNCPIILYYMKLYVVNKLNKDFKIDDLFIEKLIKHKYAIPDNDDDNETVQRNLLRILKESRQDFSQILHIS